MSNNPPLIIVASKFLDPEEHSDIIRHLDHYDELSIVELDTIEENLRFAEEELLDFFESFNENPELKDDVPILSSLCVSYIDSGGFNSEASYVINYDLFESLDEMVKEIEEFDKNCENYKLRSSHLKDVKIYCAPCRSTKTNEYIKRLTKGEGFTTFKPFDDPENPKFILKKKIKK